nr:chromatin modification-related protein MEAF6-like isoform X2 [Ipomoea batatas]GMD18651.1 chromatin modification-related protein MEAF6-like isoform X2 [Ipomoea batatas]
METSYLQDPSQCGNVLKGFEGFLSSSKSTTLLKRSRKFQPDDRLFSLSSVTSPAVCYITYSYSTMVLSMSFVL